MELERKLNSLWWTLRVAIGVTAFLAGLDKFFNLLTTWSMYLSPLAERILPVSPEHFMKATGVIEMAVGLAILFRYTRIAAYVAAAWLLAIAANLLVSGNFYDLAVRDVNLAIAAFVLAQLTEVRQTVTIPGVARTAPQASILQGDSSHA